jgi:hypothetical protein
MIRLLTIGFILATGLFAGRAAAATIAENFSTAPSSNGWKMWGNTNLFVWDSTNQHLAVTWDNTKPNSYYYRPLGTILAKSDAFSLAFDLQLTSAASTASQIAIGLFNYSKATNSTFSRPAASTPNLFEFDYYANNGSGEPAIAASLSDTNVAPGSTKNFRFIYDNLPLEVGTTYRVTLNHAAGSTNLTALVAVNGQTYTTLPALYGGPITDFRIDTLSISSYGGGLPATPAHGFVDNFSVSLPPPPIQNLTGAFSNATWRVSFNNQTNWLYTLQRTTDLLTWSEVTTSNVVAGTVVTLTDPTPPANQAFYRVQAARP